MVKWFDVALQHLAPEDKDEYNYPVRCDGKQGYLVLSQRKVLFLEEKGFISKHYDVILDIPYEHIDEITVKGHALFITEKITWSRHNIISSFDFPISTIENTLRELRDAAVSLATPIVA
jgi:hypothetical protein